MALLAKLPSHPALISYLLVSQGDPWEGAFLGHSHTQTQSWEQSQHVPHHTVQMNPSLSTSVAAVLLEILLCPCPWCSPPLGILFAWRKSCSLFTLVFRFSYSSVSQLSRYISVRQVVVLCVWGQENLTHLLPQNSGQLISSVPVVSLWTRDPARCNVCVWQYVSNNSLISFRSSLAEGSDPERSLSDLTNPLGYCLSEEMSLMLGSENWGRGIYSAAVTSECQK